MHPCRVFGVRAERDTLAALAAYGRKSDEPTREQLYEEAKLPTAKEVALAAALGAALRRPRADGPSGQGRASSLKERLFCWGSVRLAL